MQIKKIFTGKWQVPLLAITACILWGTAFPSLKISYKIIMPLDVNSFDRMLFASLRFLLASLLLFSPLIFSKERKIIFNIKDYLIPLIMLGILQTGLQYFFFYNGLARTTGVKSSIIMTSGIFMTVIASHFVYDNDKLSIKRWLGLLAGFSGVVLVNLSRGEFSFTFDLQGEGFLLLAAVVSTAGSFLAKKLSGQLNAMLITAWQMFFGSMLLLLFSLQKSSLDRLSFTPVAGVLLFYLAFVSAAAFAIWYTLIKYNPLGYITSFKFMTPVSGVLLSALFLAGESVTFMIFVALLLVSIGIIIINYKPVRFKEKYSK